jgi:DNA-binding response OmpR family regulator
MPTSLKILLIEDDGDDIDFLKTAFAENEHQVSWEVLIHGDLINKYLESNKVLPDLIVMDLNLPKLHGREVLCRIRENPRFNSVPIAVVTTSSLEEDKSYCKEKGADKYFVKPSSPEGFANLVSALYKMGSEKFKTRP